MVRAGRIDVLRVFLTIYVIGDMISQSCIFGNMSISVSLKFFEQESLATASPMISVLWVRSNVINDYEYATIIRNFRRYLWTIQNVFLMIMSECKQILTAMNNKQTSGIRFHLRGPFG